MRVTTALITGSLVRPNAPGKLPGLLARRGILCRDIKLYGLAVPALVGGE